MSYDGSVVFDTHIDTSGFSSGIQKINRKLTDVGAGAKATAAGLGQLPEGFDQASSSSSRFIDIIKGSGVFRIIEKGVNTVVSSLDSAINRVDTMNRFPLMMEQLGYRAEDAASAVSALSAGVQGLPTTLDQVVSTAQRLTVLTGNLDNSVQTTIALNNAFLASGSGADGAARGLEQYIQILSRGKAGMEEWRTLQETMGTGLTRVAEAFGYAGESAQMALYEALQSGEITMSQFNAKLIELNRGVGGFADLAKTSSTGIRTAWTNMQTAIVRGTADIITSIDAGLSQTKFKSIQNSIETLGKGAKAVLQTLAPAFELVASQADKLAVVLGVVAVAYGANKAVNAFTKAQQLAAAAIAAADAAQVAAIPTLSAKTAAEAREAAVVAANTAAQKTGTVATEADIVARMAQNGVITAGTFVLGGLTTGMGLATVASGLLTTATTALGAAIKVLLGPVGWTTAGITALVAGATALYKWATADSEAYKAQADAVSELADAQEQLVKDTANSTTAHTESRKAIRVNASAAAELTKAIDELDSSESKSITQTKQKASLVEELNEQYQDLGLTYDETTDQMNLTTEQLREYIDAQEQLQDANAVQERYNELLTEEATIRESITELDAKEIELADQLEQKIISQGEYNELMQQLNDTRAGYIEQEQAIAAQESEIKAQMTALDTEHAQQVVANAEAQKAANEAAAEAMEDEMQRQADALATYTAAATNYMDQISTTSEISVSKMIANLEHNQAAVSQWADNLVILSQRGLDQGLLQQLRDAGPESAGLVNELVNASDDEISRLSEVFQNGSALAVNTLLTELGLPSTLSGARDAGSSLVDNVSTGVSDNDAVAKAAQETIAEAKQAVQSAVSTSDFGSVGRAMIDGITAGVNSGMSSLVAAMQQAVYDAAASAKAAAQINSPSKLFRKLIGFNIMHGWSLGIKDGEPLVTKSTVRAMDALRGAIDGATPQNLVSSMRATVSGMQYSLAGKLRSMPAVQWNSVTSGGSAPGQTTNIQNNYFEQPMQAPDEIARALRIQQTYGLAGAR